MTEIWSKYDTHFFYCYRNLQLSGVMLCWAVDFLPLEMSFFLMGQKWPIPATMGENQSLVGGGQPAHVKTASGPTDHSVLVSLASVPCNSACCTDLATLMGEWVSLCVLLQLPNSLVVSTEKRRIGNLLLNAESIIHWMTTSSHL